MNYMNKQNQPSWRTQGAWQADYNTGEIFADTTPEAIRTTLQKWQGEQGNALLENNFFQEVYKTNPNLAYKLLDADGYDAQKKMISDAYGMKSMGFVPGLMNNANQNSVWRRAMTPAQQQQFQQQFQQQQNRRIIDNYMASGAPLAQQAGQPAQGQESVRRDRSGGFAGRDSQ